MFCPYCNANATKTPTGNGGDDPDDLWVGEGEETYDYGLFLWICDAVGKDHYFYAKDPEDNT